MSLSIPLDDLTLELVYSALGPGTIHYRAIDTSSYSPETAIPYLKLSSLYELIQDPLSSSSYPFTMLIRYQCLRSCEPPKDVQIVQPDFCLYFDSSVQTCSVCGRAFTIFLILLNADYSIRITFGHYVIQLKLFSYTSFTLRLPAVFEVTSILRI